MKFKWFFKLINFFAIALIVLSLFALLTVVMTPSGQVPQVMGFSILQVLTGSMEPTIPEGSMLLIQKTAPETLQTGDIISFFVNGDFNYHHLEVGLTAGTDIKWLPATQLTFLGWQYVQVDTSELDPSYTYLLAGFRLVQEQSLYTLSGAFFIDHLQVERNAGISDISADTPAWQVEYYNLQGIRVTNPTPGQIYIRRQGPDATTIRH